MALLRPRGERKRVTVPKYTVLRCPLNGHQVSFCMGLCEPVGTQGVCGRLAPHAMMGKTQRAIAKYLQGS